MPKHNQPLQIRLTEPVIFLKGPSTGLDFRGRPQTVRQDGQPAIVRGLLTLRLNKPTRIRSITIKLEGKARTEWPEGIGSKRMDTSEEHVILYDQTNYFDAYQHDEDGSRSRSARRARSVGPGAGAGHDDEIDDDVDLTGVPGENDDPEEWLEIGRRRDATSRRQNVVRSSSAMPGTHDNHTWHRDGFSRRPSFSDRGRDSNLTPPALEIANLTMRDRGPSPAYTPTASPPRTSIPLPGGPPSRPSSLRHQSTSLRENLNSREPALSPIASAAPSQTTSERGNSAEAEHRRPAHSTRGTLLNDSVEENSEWSPNPSASNLREFAIQDEDGDEDLGASAELRPILNQRSTHNSTGEVRFQDQVEQKGEEGADVSTDRRESVQSDDETPEEPSRPPVLAPQVESPAAITNGDANGSVPGPTPTTAGSSAGARAASVRTMNSTFSTSSASLSVDSHGEPMTENHPIAAGVQAISVANTPAQTTQNSPASSAPPSLHQRSSTETLNTAARNSDPQVPSPNASRRTSLLSNSARRSSEQNGAELSNRPSQDNLVRQGRPNRLGSTSTIIENPSASTNGSQPNLPSSMNSQPRPQRSASGTSSIASGPSTHPPSFSHLRVGSSSHRDPSEDSRGRKSHKFSLAATLRGLSREVKETFHHGGRAASKSRSRMSSPVRGASESIYSDRNASMASSSMARLGSGTNVNETIRRSGSRNPSFRQDEFQPAFGRGGAGSRASRSRERDSSTVRTGDRDERSRSRARGRHMGMKVLTDKLGIGEHDDNTEDVHNWKEFRKGTYNYPISFPIPVNAPPTIHAEFGSVTYRLKASVIRVGALTPNLTEDMEVVMIATPQEDDMEETENVIVERQWEEQMRYQITLGGKAFPIAGTIPISIRLMPLLKCKIHRLTVALEEKTDYFAQERKVARHETPKRFVLLFIKQPDHKERIEPLLPIISDDPNAAENSPVADMARQAVLNSPLADDLYDLERDPNDSMYASLMEPMGPWHLEKDLTVPDCLTKIKFTTKHEQTNIAVGHWLKVTIRVERGDDEALDTKGRRKQFDIIIETPIKLLDCRVNPQWNSLPTYSALSKNITAAPGICSVHGAKTGAPLGPKRSQNDSSIASGSAAGAGAGAAAGALPTPPRSPGPDSAGPSSYVHAHASRRGTADSTPASTPGVNGSPHGHAVVQETAEDTLLERNIVYDRLMSGQVTETGEVPPTYGEALADAAKTRSSSRVRLNEDDADGQGQGQGLGGVPMGRGRSEASGRGRSRLREQVV